MKLSFVAIAKAFHAKHNGDSIETLWFLKKIHKEEVKYGFSFAG